MAQYSPSNPGPIATSGALAFRGPFAGDDQNAAINGRIEYNTWVGSNSGWMFRQSFKVRAGTTILNNIFQETGSGAGRRMVRVCTYTTAYLGTVTQYDWDYNCYYDATGPMKITWHTSEYTSLATWQSITVHDDNSIAEDPNFVSDTGDRTGDYTAQNANASAMGCFATGSFNPATVGSDRAP